MTTGTTIGTTEPLRLRHEVKHQLSPQEDLVLTSRLGKLFPRDGHAGPDGSYRVTSLYFDTPYDTALREKLDGVDRREKFRLRYYGERPDFLKLEKKFKVNGLCGKRSARLTLEEAERLLSGEDAFLLERGEPLLSELYHKLRGTLLRPRTVVCYDREAFLYAPGNVRVTLDRNLRTCGDSAGFLSPRSLSPETPGRFDGTGGQVRRLSPRPGAAGRPDAGPPGGGLFQIRPVPAV